ncbi:MAG: outer membrane protein OmpA-like peptidoglycan-associated protein [Cyclobacteriaceae bacterium]|jgi:outer membrane protein OmpA-like peptidoglycan-associated protein
MRKLNLAIAVLVGAAILSSCTLGKMVKLASDQDLQVNPNPLEVHGGQVPFDLSAVLPPKMLPTGKIFTINTIYQFGDQEIKVGSVEFKAADFPNSSSSTSRKTQSFSFDYQDGLNPGTLFVEGVASDPKSGKAKTSPRMEVAKGLIMTSSFAKPIAFASYADHDYNDKEELIPTKVSFFFEQGRSTLNARIETDGKSNGEKTKNLSAFIAEKNVTRTVTITGTHSPEGTETINSDLSEDRASSIEAYYRKQMKKYDYMGKSDSIKFILKPVVQNWGTLKSALITYTGINVESKGQVNKIINGTGTFEEKEKSLKTLSFYDKLLKEVYPGLRTAKTEILTVKPKKSNPEIAILAKQIGAGEISVDTLNAQELMFGATLTPVLAEKEAIYLASTKKSGSWAAHNNLGAVYIQMAMASEGADMKKALESAVTQLEIASNKNSNEASVGANLAAANMLMAEYDKAFEFITSSEQASPSNEVAGKLKGMKGAIQLMNAEYDAAKASFNSASDSKAVSFDKGLASLLAGEYNDAVSILKTIKDDDKVGADASYLLAVAGARQDDGAMVKASLKNAIQKNPNLKDKAANDLEFMKFGDAVAEAIK